MSANVTHYYALYNFIVVINNK